MTTSFLAGGRTYPGGKGKAFQNLINLMPPHRRYIETHLGAGAVMLHKRPALINVGIELDERVVARWRKSAPPGCQVVAGDAIGVLPRLNPGEGDLVYCDPPYVPSTKRRAKTYRHEYAESDHVRLIELLRSLNCHVVLSGYENDLYATALAGWHRTDYATRTHAGTVIESAWTNYLPGAVLHDYSFVGGCFREREGVRRRVEALRSKLDRAAPVERNAVLAALAETRPDVVIAAAERIR